MSRFNEPQFEPLLEKLRTHLCEERYGKCARFSYPYAARAFLRYLERRGVGVRAVTTAQVEQYLDSRRLKGARRPYPNQFRRMHRAAIQMLLRVICGKWPPDVVPRTPEEIADRQIIEAYESWMKDLRGLSPETRRQALGETRPRPWWPQAVCSSWPRRSLRRRTTRASSYRCSRSSRACRGSWVVPAGCWPTMAT